MKRVILFLSCFISITFIHAQVAYVDQSASGNNDGSSWADAYTSLHDALGNTAAGEIWVAAGTYITAEGAADTNAYYQLTSPVALYGGFAGTESSIGDRDLNANETILSADFNGDDVDNDFSMNKGDNSHHCLFIDSLGTTAVIDGFIFRGAFASANEDLPQTFTRGGGLFSFSTLNIDNCRFDNNFAPSGGALFISSQREAGSNSTMRNCNFEKNTTNNRGAGVYIFNLENILIEDCTFANNTTVRGAFYPNLCRNVMVRGCTFESNTHAAADGFGGTVFVWQGQGITFDNCNFNNNVAGNGAVIYTDGRDIDIDPNNLIFRNCAFTGNNSNGGFGGSCIYSWQSGFTVEGGSFTNNQGANAGALYVDGRDKDITNQMVLLDGVTFESNSSSGFGGAMYFWQSGFTMDNCTFVGNTSDNAGGIYGTHGQKTVSPENIIITNTLFTGNIGSDFGGGAAYFAEASLTMDNCNLVGNRSNNGASIFMTGNNKDIIISNTMFSTGAGDFGGALNCYGDTSTFLIEGCRFSENSANNSGGAIITGFKANTTIRSSTFDTNGGGSGGAIRVQNDTTVVVIDSCSFINQTVDGSGGAIQQTNGASLSILNSEFLNNFASFGGAVSTSVASNAGPTGTGTLRIENSNLSFNIANDQGGAINMLSTNAVIQNSVISNNFSVGGVSGGGISFNANDSTTSVVDLIHNTFAANDGEVGDGFSAFTGSDSSELTIRLLNNIFDNNDNSGDNYALEGGTPNIVSMGGNISTDASLSAVMISTNDQNEVSGELYVDRDNFDFHLNEMSPAIDNGVAQGAPAVDFDGVTRVGAPDAGAYEYVLDTGIKNVLVENDDQLRAMPNPVGDLLTIELENDWTGEQNVTLYNIQGQMVAQWVFNKQEKSQQAPFDVSNVATGQYYLVVGNKNAKVAMPLVKM